MKLACLSPYHAFVLGTKSNGKKDIKITENSINHLEIEKDKIHYITTPYRFSSGTIISDYMDVPCGRCLACRLDRARDWTCRVLLEAQEHSQSCFITLTYDDIHIPRRMYGSHATGEVVGDSYSLDRRDVQLFLKRLRKHLEPLKIRYFGCGEYGESTFRPHYHMVLFGWTPPDLKKYSIRDGNVYWISEVLSSIWGKGHVVIGEVSAKSAGYVARYTTKKLYGDDSEFYLSHNLQPPFLMASLRPAIGSNYLKNNLEHIFEDGRIVVSTNDGGRRFPPPRYFYKILQAERPDLYELHLQRCADAMNLKKENLKCLTKQGYYDILSVELDNLKKRTSSLLRNKL